jgi:hypothetical protein
MEPLWSPSSRTSSRPPFSTSHQAYVDRSRPISDIGRESTSAEVAARCQRHRPKHWNLGVVTDRLRLLPGPVAVVSRVRVVAFWRKSDTPEARLYG